MSQPVQQSTNTGDEGESHAGDRALEGAQARSPTDQQGQGGEFDETSPADQIRANKLKARRRQLRGKITRAINRLRDSMVKQVISARQLEGEVKELTKDINDARDVHCELYDFVTESELPRMDRWEAELNNERFDLIEHVENYIAAGVNAGSGNVGRGASGRDQIVTRSDIAGHYVGTSYRWQFQWRCATRTTSEATTDRCVPFPGWRIIGLWCYPRTRTGY